MKKIFLQILQYIVTFIVIIFLVIITKPKTIGLPEDLFDSIIVILTLVGLMIDKLNNQKLNDIRRNIIDYLFNLTTIKEFCFRIIVVLMSLAVIFLGISYIFNQNLQIWNMALSLCLLVVPYILIYIGMININNEYEDGNSSFIYYLILLILYILYKFL